MTKLKYVYVDSPLLKTISEQINQLSNVTQLSLFGNYSQIPPLKLINLKNLQLKNYYSFYSIHFEITEVINIEMSSLVNLESMKIEGNFQFQNNDLTHLKHFKYLYSYYSNHFEKIPILPNSLKTLDAKFLGNQWTQSLSHLSNLKKLNLQILNGSFPHLFFTNSSSFPFLETIVISGSFEYQETHPTEFSSLPNLNSLRIYSNINYENMKANIFPTNLPNTLKYLEFENLNFGGQNLPTSLQELNNLTQISLTNNNLSQYIPNELFSFLNNSNIDCYLENQPSFNCDSFEFFSSKSMCNVECYSYFEPGVWYLPTTENEPQNSNPSTFMIGQSYLELNKSVIYTLSVMMKYIFEVKFKDQSMMKQHNYLISYSRPVQFNEILSPTQLGFEIINRYTSYDLIFMIPENNEYLIEKCPQFSPNQWYNLKKKKNRNCLEFSEEIVSQIPSCLKLRGKFDNETKSMSFQHKFLLSPFSNDCFINSSSSSSPSNGIKRKEIEEQEFSNEFKLMKGCQTFKESWSCCGDGIVSLMETCDDGNTKDDDGCSQSCSIENGWVCESSSIESPSNCSYLCENTGQFLKIKELCFQEIKPNENNQDSVGVIVGSGVGGGLVVVVIVAIVVIFVKKRKQEKESYLIDESEIEFHEVLGEGNFGQVWKGVWKETTEVAIKITKMKTPSSSSNDSNTNKEQQQREFKRGVKEFQEEAKFYTKLPPHPNIVQLLGVVLPQPKLKSRISLKNSNEVNDQDQLHSQQQLQQEHEKENKNKNKQKREGNEVMIVLEFLPSGNLSQWMKNTNVLESSTEEQKLKLQIELGKGIAAGLHHLHSHGIIHRDLAARNVLVQVGVVDEKTEQQRGRGGERGGMKVVPKLGDFGLSISMKGKKLVPVRWSPPEVLENPQNTSFGSDVWSFGIVLIEISYFCSELPYKNLNNRQVVEFILSGNTIGPQIGTHPRLISMIGSCLSYDKELRPTLTQLFKLFQDFQTQILLDSSQSSQKHDSDQRTSTTASSSSFSSSRVVYWNGVDQSGGEVFYQQFQGMRAIQSFDESSETYQ